MGKWVGVKLATKLRTVKLATSRGSYTETAVVEFCYRSTEWHAEHRIDVNEP